MKDLNKKPQKINKELVRARKLGYLGIYDKSDESTTIYVGNLNYNKNELDIKSLFGEFGQVTYVKLVKDSKTKMNTGIAFVQMPHKKQALKAIESLDATAMGGRTLKISIAQERPEKKVNKRRSR